MNRFMLCAKKLLKCIIIVLQDDCIPQRKAVQDMIQDML